MGRENLLTEDTIMAMPTDALRRQFYHIDLWDESGEKKKFTIPREVAALINEKNKRIAELQALLRKHNIVEDAE